MYAVQVVVCVNGASYSCAVYGLHRVCYGSDVTTKIVLLKRGKSFCPSFRDTLV